MVYRKVQHHKNGQGLLIAKGSPPETAETFSINQKEKENCPLYTPPNTQRDTETKVNLHWILANLKGEFDMFLQYFW